MEQLARRSRKNHFFVISKTFRLTTKSTGNRRPFRVGHAVGEARRFNEDILVVFISHPQVDVRGHRPKPFGRGAHELDPKSHCPTCAHFHRRARSWLWQRRTGCDRHATTRGSDRACGVLDRLLEDRLGRWRGVSRRRRLHERGWHELRRMVTRLVVRR